MLLEMESQEMKPFRTFAGPRKFVGLLALSLSLSVGAAIPAGAELPPAELVKALQSGGYIVYMRHTKTNKNQEDLDHNDLSNCATQRNLSDEGRAQARVIAEAFRELGIKVDSVFSSPYCRAKQTANIAFGDYQISNDLRYLSHIPDDERPAAIERIKRMLGQAPSNGGIVILVSHTENLKQTTGIWPKDSGVMHVFKPTPGGGYSHLGKIDPGEWTQLAHLGADEKRCVWFLCW